ncbi:PEP-utilizing enzyme [Arthrobacter sp. SLBN-112]|uniref:PEP-utilizing enzyme n=1 Tax=Arthrobacter sp. SLBN-112 TaxID=2768452 RepID=UPI003FA416F3
MFCGRTPETVRSTARSRPWPRKIRSTTMPVRAWLLISASWPAVVGVADATTRLSDGQGVTVDGAAGTVSW